ncbi:DNA cytosine methyltransferase [Amycolatopsis nalaikhensis]|uniref:DNA (cytosine-5-)-methyltransferase n=1 Tax=Amycolatopsis nalaikhensis TaxID=715472 RepID=A0ABY8XXZ5_9PSEU|nr:DNA cytosine methyltransferase [Amycolatopsis sp. 2-2]WIV60600.1 DNA cytosine methyltransferase [Amycolatopsis sp. 2-2]
MTDDNDQALTFHPERRLKFLDVCSGAGGLALGLEQAGFEPVMLIDNRGVACDTLRQNRPEWDVRQLDLLEFDPVHDQHVYDVDLLSAGLPRVRAAASVNRPSGSDVEIALIRATIMLMHAVQPKALLIENMAELADDDKYRLTREFVTTELAHLGYRGRWFVMNAADHRVPQDRRQGIFVALKDDRIDAFEEPARVLEPPVTVGEALRDSMAARGWPQAAEWAAHADRLAPTLVGGSWNRGGGDLGPSGTKAAWQRLGVNGGSLADEAPGPDYRWRPDLDRSELVRLTVDQAARLQGFPSDWRLAGGKTARYRQVGNASPPPVARALGDALRNVLS